MGRAVFRLYASCLIGLATAACSLAPAVQTNSLDYNNVIEDVSNKSLITNVLRGRDNMPLYFPDLAIIRGSVSATGSVQSSFPYVPGPLQIGPLAAGSNPSFDIAPSNTKQFYQGLLNPISKSLFAYYIEKTRGVSTFGPAFLMMVNAIEVTKNGRTRAYGTATREDQRVYLRHFKQWIYGPQKITVVKNTPKAGIDVAIDAKSFVDVSAADLEIAASAPGRVRLTKRSAGVTICAYSEDDAGYVPLEIDANSTIREPAGFDLDSIKASANNCDKLGQPARQSRARYKLHLRSVEQLFFFLGSVVNGGGPHWTREDHYEADQTGCPALSFHLFREPIARPRFSVSYRDGNYYVAEYGSRVPCSNLIGDATTNTQDDTTTALLVILNDLLNLNRDANEIPTTRAVTTVGGRS